MQITVPCVVSLAWRLEDAQGHLIDTLEEPIEFFFGGDDLLPKVEEVLQDQGRGFEATLHLEPEHAFGDYDAQLVCFENRDLFTEPVEPGMQFEGLPAGCQTPDMPADRLYNVTEVYESHVVLDGNHPLAGLALVLHLKVHDVREASPQEVETGSVGELGTGMFTLGSSSAPAGTTLH